MNIKTHCWLVGLQGGDAGLPADVPHLVHHGHGYNNRTSLLHYLHNTIRTSRHKFSTLLHLQRQHHLLVLPEGHDPGRGGGSSVVKYLDLPISKAGGQKPLVHIQAGDAAV